MALSFAELKKNRSNSLETMKSEVTKLSAGGFANKDEGYWAPTVDTAGNGYAVIRFLDAPEGEDLPFIRYWDHGFQGPGGWYIEKSRSSMGPDEADPVSEMNRELWNQGENSEGRKIVSGHGQKKGTKRQLHYVANILVVEDPEKPDNNGKVFRFRFGKKIFDKLNDLMNPKFKDEKAINPYDLWEGANFKLKIRKVEGYRNYDKSEFVDQSPIAKSDADIEAIWKQTKSLTSIIAPDQFKTYDELKKKLNKVIGPMIDQVLGRREAAPATEARTERASAEPAQQAAETTQVDSTGDDDEDEGTSFFEKLKQR